MRLHLWSCRVFSGKVRGGVNQNGRSGRNSMMYPEQILKLPAVPRKSTEAR